MATTDIKSVPIPQIPPILSPGECLQNIIIEKINKKFKELGIDGEIKQGVKNIDN